MAGVKIRFYNLRASRAPSLRELGPPVSNCGPFCRDICQIFFHFAMFWPLTFLGAGQAPMLGDLGARPPKLGPRAQGLLLIFTPAWAICTCMDSTQ